MRILKQRLYMAGITAQTQPGFIESVWDNGGDTADRYTVIIKDFASNAPGTYLGLSENPEHPAGFSQFGTGGKSGSHLGERLTWMDLPENVRTHVLKRMKEEQETEAALPKLKVSPRGRKDLRNIGVDPNLGDRVKLIGIQSEIYEDSYEEGELGDTGAGLPYERIGKEFDSMQDALDYLKSYYGLSDNINDYHDEEDYLQTDKMVADHSHAQNGGWMKPTDREIREWKKGELKLYSEHYTIEYERLPEESTAAKLPKLKVRNKRDLKNIGLAPKTGEFSAGFSIYVSDDSYYLESNARERGIELKDIDWKQVGDDSLTLERNVIKWLKDEYGIKCQDEGHGSNGDLIGTCYSNRADAKEFMEQHNESEGEEPFRFEGDMAIHTGISEQSLDIGIDDAQVSFWDIKEG